MSESGDTTGGGLAAHTHGAPYETHHAVLEVEEGLIHHDVEFARAVVTPDGERDDEPEDCAHHQRAAYEPLPEHNGHALHSLHDAAGCGCRVRRAIAISDNAVAMGRVADKRLAAVVRARRSSARGRAGMGRLLILIQSYKLCRRPTARQ